MMSQHERRAEARADRPDWPTDDSIADSRWIVGLLPQLAGVRQRMPVCDARIVLAGVDTDLSYVACVLRGEFGGLR